MKIIIIGYKHAGKTSCAKFLARHLNLPHFDLDQAIEKKYFQTYKVFFSCRHIMQHQGELFFRKLEINCLRELLSINKNGIYSLGGGAVTQAHQLHLLKHHFIIHLYTSREIIWRRLLHSGMPAFFPKQNPDAFFMRDFYKKNQFYFSIAHYSIYYRQAASVIWQMAKFKKIAKNPLFSWEK